MEAMVGFSHCAKQVYVASSAVASIVYSLLRKPYFKTHWRKQLTRHFNSTDKKPLHAGVAYRNLDNTSASNTYNGVEDFGLKGVEQLSICSAKTCGIDYVMASLFVKI